MAYNEYVTYGYYTNNAFSFRPIVCLNSGTKLIDNGDNTYSIKEPITAKAEYNEETCQIEVKVAYTEHGVSEIMLNNTNKLPITDENGIITANTKGIALAIGTNTVTITDNNGNTKKLEIKVLKSSYYGKEVTNYTCASEEVDKWRVFHIDEENIYLIADDYVEYKYLPTSTSGTKLDQGNDYTAGFGSILSDYTGSAGIIANTDEKAQKWLSKYLTICPDSSWINSAKAVEYMMDTKAWSAFKGEKAEYAIGGPTLELLCASYKETHPDKYIEYGYVSFLGYRLRWSNETKDAYYISGLVNDEFEGIYTKSDITKSACMWLASPSEYRHDMMLVATSSGSVSNTSCGNLYGFRPVVCLNSGTKLVVNGDGTLSIQ